MFGFFERQQKEVREVEVPEEGQGGARADEMTWAELVGGQKVAVPKEIGEMIEPDARLKAAMEHGYEGNGLKNNSWERVPHVHSNTENQFIPQNKKEERLAAMKKTLEEQGSANDEERPDFRKVT